MRNLFRQWLGVRVIGFLGPIMSAIGLFLALWVVIPAPIFALVPLSVGAPEISPWLVLGNAIALLLNLKVSRLGAIASAIALGLSVLPLLQFPSTNQRAAAAFQTAFPQSVQLAPFNLLRAIPSVRQTKGIEFAKPDGVPLTMNIYRPQAPGKNPAIVMIYGGAWRTGDPNANEDFSLYMAAQGYTVLAIDYRHAPQHKFPAQIQDIETAFKFIQQRADEYEVRLDRLVVMGRSAGAHLALLAAFQGVIPVRGTIAYYSPVDLTEGYNNPPVPDPINSREVLLAFLGGTPQDLPELYRQASPYDWVQPALPPTLLIYGGKDHIVRPNYGRALHEKLIASNNKSIFIEIPWADHAFDAIFNGISNQLALYYTEKFLAETLKP